MARSSSQNVRGILRRPDRLFAQESCRVTWTKSPSVAQQPSSMALRFGSQKTGPHPAATRTLQCATGMTVCRDDQQATAHFSSASNMQELQIATLRLPAAMTHCAPHHVRSCRSRKRSRNRKQGTGTGSCHTEPQQDRINIPVATDFFHLSNNELAVASDLGN